MPFFTPNTPPANDIVSRRLRIPRDSNWLALVNGALTPLIYESMYEEKGTMGAEDTAQVFKQMLIDFWSSDGWMIGSIFPYVTAAPPPFTLPCDGSTHNRTDYPELYALLDAFFIVDADTFNTPDLRGRTVIGTGTGSGLTARALGDSVGEESHVLSQSEMPSHSHSQADHTHLAAVALAGAIPVATPLIANPLTVTGNTGGDGAHNNMQPSLALNYAIIAR